MNDTVNLIFWSKMMFAAKKNMCTVDRLQLAMHPLHTCVLRSWLSCLRRSVAFCCRPLRWSCICRRLTLLTALEGGGGIRASGADGVLAANHRAGQHEGST